MEQTLEVQRRVLGPEGPGTLTSMFFLVQWLMKSPDASDRDRARAVDFGRQVAERGQKNQHHWKWLAVAEYRNGHWDAAVQAAEKCIEVRGDGGWAFQFIVLALAHARRGEMDQAREWYAKARPAIDGGKGLSDTPRWLVDEAVSLLGVAPPQNEAKK